MGFREPHSTQPRHRDGGVIKEKLSPVQGRGAPCGQEWRGETCPVDSGGQGRPSPWVAAGAEVRIRAL